MEANVINRTLTEVYFELFVPTLPEDVREVATTAQSNAGYDPLGYGGPYDLKVTVNQTGGYTLNWMCYGSAD